MTTKDNIAGDLFSYKRLINLCVKLLRKSKKVFYSNHHLKTITYIRKFWETIKPDFTEKALKDDRIATAWKVYKYGRFSGPYFPAFGQNTERYSYLSVFSPNVGKYGREKTPYLDTFHAVSPCWWRQSYSRRKRCS